MGVYLMMLEKIIFTVIRVRHLHQKPIILYLAIYANRDRGEGGGGGYSPPPPHTQ
jgi:hypothetical protein